MKVLPTSAVPDVRARVVAEGPSVPEAVKYAPAGAARENTVDAAPLARRGAADADSTAPVPSRSVNAPVLTSNSTLPKDADTRTDPGSGEDTLKGAYAGLGTTMSESTCCGGSVGERLADTRHDRSPSTASSTCHPRDATSAPCGVGVQGAAAAAAASQAMMHDRSVARILVAVSSNRRRTDARHVEAEYLQGLGAEAPAAFHRTSKVVHWRASTQLPVVTGYAALFLPLGML